MSCLLEDECLKSLYKFNEALIYSNTRIKEEYSHIAQTLTIKTNPSKEDYNSIENCVKELRKDRDMGLYIQKEVDKIQQHNLNFGTNQLKKATYCSLLADVFINLENLFSNTRELLMQFREFYSINHRSISFTE